VYAFIRSGGKQHKVAVGDTITVEIGIGAPGDAVTFPAVLVVDGDTVTSAPADLASFTVSGEIVGQAKGPKIRIVRYKNKTGYKARQGHRQKYLEVKINGISAA
jgi:large subunit ribosomal protein L21